MPQKSSLKEALERPDVVAGGGRPRSGTPARFLLRAVDDVSRPLDVVRRLRAGGVSLKRAHAALERLAEGRTAAVEIVADDAGMAAAELRRLGVEAMPVRPPEVDLKAVRAGLGLSQAEFALAFGLQLDSVQNWEQGRSRPDPAIRTLLAVIARRPDIVQDILTEG